MDPDAFTFNAGHRTESMDHGELSASGSKIQSWKAQICSKYISLAPIYTYIYTLWQTNIAIGNGHRNSGFTH